ncbi:MAG: TIGR02302 family protein [Rhizobiales bacterium]|nr:TIGR02302 family protein [Hyphomicrobiales bacterium]
MDLSESPGAVPRIEARPAEGGQAMLDRAVSRARWSILWERLWPALASIATAAGLFLALSWLGLWLWLPPVGRAIGLGAFCLIGAISLLPLLHLRLPSRTETLRRLDRNSGLTHRPATTISDKIAGETDDGHALALWRAHIERALRSARILKAGLPMPRVAARDPMALRALVLVLVIATFFVAGGDRMKRVAAAFDWQGAITPANFRIDAWISPPPYTAKPPLILQGLRPGEPMQTANTPIAVPVGSTLVIRASGNVNLDVSTTGGLAEPEADAQPAAGRGATERRFTIDGDGSATVRSASDLRWQFTAIPDRAPTIALTDDPEATPNGLQMSYKLEDDYGVVGAQAIFKLMSRRGTNGHPPRNLYEAPEFALSLPQTRTRSGVGRTTKSVNEHPWAGADVSMTLVARDEGGHEGTTDPVDLRLPERAFTNPVARALIEQRRNLALDGDAQALVLTALDALTWAPEKFKIDSKVYLGLRSIFYQLARAKSDDQLRDVVARMWDMAVTLEDGNMSDAEQALRAAQDALRQALERGASEEEIKKLMDQLRAAIDRFMQALAEQMRRNPDQMARPLDPNARELRPEDLKSMLDRMEQMARQGSHDSARKMLDALANMLNNLQMARPGQQGDDSDDDMNSALDQLGDMIRRQQQLRDRTFEQGQDERRQQGQRGRRVQNGQNGQQGQQSEQDGKQGQQGRQGQQGQQGMGELREQQQALRQQLDKLLDEFRKRGMGQPGQQGENEMQQLGRAGEAMGDAEGQLGDSDADGAVDSQGRALEALRRGAQDLAQSMQQQQGNGQGPGQPGRMGQSRAQQETDPLGRPLRGRWDDSTLPNTCLNTDDPKCFPARRRAEEILNELRRRFGEGFRPQFELEYIERLLRDIR